MLRTLGLPELVLFVACLALTVPAIFYLLTLQKALTHCAPASRTMSPGQVWLLLIPLFNLVWMFIVVANISKSLHNEFLRRNIPTVEAEPGKAVGLAMSCLMIASIVPLLGGLFSIAGFVCWIIYWIK